MSRDLSGASNSYLAVGGPDIRTVGVTFHCWIRSDAATAAHPSVAGRWAGGLGARWLLYVAGGTNLDFTILGDDAGGQGIQQTTTFPYGRWVPVGGVWRASTRLSVWQDGVEVALAAGVKNALASGGPHALLIGSQNTDVQVQDGKMAECAVWDTWLTPAEMGALAKGANPNTIRAANLQGYWPLWGVAYPDPNLCDKAGKVNATTPGTVVAAAHAPVAPYCFPIAA